MLPKAMYYFAKKQGVFKDVELISIRLQVEQALK